MQNFKKIRTFRKFKFSKSSKVRKSSNVFGIFNGSFRIWSKIWYYFLYTFEIIRLTLGMSGSFAINIKYTNFFCPLTISGKENFKFSQGVNHIYSRYRSVFRVTRYVTSVVWNNISVNLRKGALPQNVLSALHFRKTDSTENSNYLFHKFEKLSCEDRYDIWLQEYMKYELQV